MSHLAFYNAGASRDPTSAAFGPSESPGSRVTLTCVGRYAVRQHPQLVLGRCHIGPFSILGLFFTYRLPMAGFTPEEGEVSAETPSAGIAPG